MPYTLQQAATAVGLSKSSMLRAVRRGTISAVRDPVTGNWAIAPAELHRVFPPKPEPAEAVRGAVPDASRHGPEPAEPMVARAVLDAERARLEDAREQIADLRRRLDVADEERRRLTAILADQRAAPARRWWRFGR